MEAVWQALRSGTCEDLRDALREHPTFTATARKESSNALEYAYMHRRPDQLGVLLHPSQSVHMTELSFQSHFCNLRQYGDEIMRVLASANLENVRSVRIVDQHLAEPKWHGFLRDLVHRLPQLDELDLSRNELTDRGAFQLGMLCREAAPRKLVLNWTSFVEDRGDQFAAGFMSASGDVRRIEHLGLERASFGKTVTWLCDVLKALPSLQAIDLTNSRFGDALEDGLFAELMGALPDGLRRIDFATTTFVDAPTVATIAACVSRMPHLEELALKRVASEDAPLENVIREARNLRRLDLSGAVCHPDTLVNVFAALAGAPNLEELDVSGIKIQVDGVPTFPYEELATALAGSLRVLPRLRTLDIRRCRLNLAIVLPAAIMMPRLERLEAEGSAGWSGDLPQLLADLARQEVPRTLKYLSVSSNLANNRLADWAPLLVKLPLKYIHISDSDYDEPSLEEAIKQLATMPDLESVHLTFSDDFYFSSYVRMVQAAAVQAAFELAAQDPPVHGFPKLQNLNKRTRHRDDLDIEWIDKLRAASDRLLQAERPGECMRPYDRVAKYFPWFVSLFPDCAKEFEVCTHWPCGECPAHVERTVPPPEPPAIDAASVMDVLLTDETTNKDESPLLAIAEKLPEESRAVRRGPVHGLLRIRCVTGKDAITWPAPPAVHASSASSDSSVSDDMDTAELVAPAAAMIALCPRAGRLFGSYLWDFPRSGMDVPVEAIVPLIAVANGLPMAADEETWVALAAACHWTGADLNPSVVSELYGVVDAILGNAFSKCGRSIAEVRAGGSPREQIFSVHHKVLDLLAVQTRASVIQAMLDRHPPEALPPGMHAQITALTTDLIVPRISKESDYSGLSTCGIASLMQRARNPRAVKAQWDRTRQSGAADQGARAVLQAGERNSRARVG